MYVQRLTLRNLRGFESLDFNFRRPEPHADASQPADDDLYAGWTVITGDNGSGKTALLKSLAAAVAGPGVARVLQPNWSGWVRVGSTTANVSVQIVPHTEDKFVAGRPYEHPFWSEVEWHSNGEVRMAIPAPEKRRERGKKGPLNGPWADGASGWFAAGYGPFRRLYGASPEAQRVMSGAGRVARFATMFREDATLLECELWLRELNYRKLEKSKRDEQTLEQVLRLLNDDFLRNGVRVDHVDSDGLWLKDASGAVLPLADMSEGYRAALALMIDILRHLAQAFGTERLVEERDGRVVVTHRGSVFIDEIDAHLHPEWQRQIGFWLKSRFPRLQFIVTTHSALVCQAADRGGVFHLPPLGSGQAPSRIDDNTFKRLMDATADTILMSPAFGLTHTRSPRAVADRNDYSRLRAKKLGGGLSADESRQMSLLESRIYPDDGLDPER